MSWFDTAKQVRNQIEQNRKKKESTLEGDRIVQSLYSELSEKSEKRSIHIADATRLYRERGWVQIYSTYLKTSLYLVRNKWIKVPDPSIPRYTPEEVDSLKGLNPDELRTLHEAKEIFGGGISKGEK